MTCYLFNTLRQRRNVCHFADNIFKCIFLREYIWISINISLRFVPKGEINNILTLDQIMAWHWLGNKPLSEPMMVILLMHICTTPPHWVNINTRTKADYLPIGQLGKTYMKLTVKYKSEYKYLLSRKYIWKYHLQCGGHFVQASVC